jgi:hypothetical protein
MPSIVQAASIAANKIIATFLNSAGRITLSPDVHMRTGLGSRAVVSKSIL